MIKKILATLTILSTLTACTVTPHGGAQIHMPRIDAGGLSLSKDGLHIPNILYPIEVGGRIIPAYIDTGSLTLEEFLCTIDPNC